jgi:hypothetical protein
MRSSTSSFNAVPRRSWLLIWTLAFGVAAAIVGAVEWHWRTLGFYPNVRDSAQLWSLQRDRVYAHDRITLAILGASRIEFALDMKLLKALLPRYRPVMLAQNAHYPLAVLRDLAQDDDFHGVVLCDLETSGLFKSAVDMQQPLVDYRRQQWSPSWRAHRLLLNVWQNHAVVANPDLGLVAAIKRALGDPFHPQPDYFTFYADRGGDIDYMRTDVDAARKHFSELAADPKNQRALVEPEQWFADLADVYQWTRQIQAHGGEVIFYQSPTGKALHAVEIHRYPPELYWGRFAANAPAHVLDAADVPALSAFVEPDESHLDFRDKPAYTRALVDALVARGWLSR